MKIFFSTMEGISQKKKKKTQKLTWNKSKLREKSRTKNILVIVTTTYKSLLDFDYKSIFSNHCTTHILYVKNYYNDTEFLNFLEVGQLPF